MKVTHKFFLFIVGLIFGGVLFTGCLGKEQVENLNEEQTHLEIIKIDEENKEDEEKIKADSTDDLSEIVPENEEEEKENRKILYFVDVFQNEYEVEIIDEVEKHLYRNENFVREGEKLFYEDDLYTSRIGVDVSHHQEKIDWKKVKEAGYEFAIIRVGYRGYGLNSGTVNPDQRFRQNIEAAQEVGLDVGVYFFSQAINEKEAEEEAKFVLDMISDYQVPLPVVYDPESILNAVSRTDHISGEQFTKNTVKFCKIIKDAGYTPMVYSNMLWEAYEFDMRKTSIYPHWYADYEKYPQTPYQFEYWQYSNVGQVPGINGAVDLDIQLIKKDDN